MFDFLKTLGEGILYTLLSPIILGLLLLHMIVYVIVFFVLFIKRIVMFFGGRDMSIVSELDKAAKYHLQMHKKQMADAKNAPKNAPSPTTILQPIILQTNADGSIKAPNMDSAQSQNTRPVPHQDPIDCSTKEISYDELNNPERRDSNE